MPNWNPTVNLAIEGAINYGSTRYAAGKENLRATVVGDGSTMYGDARFIAGLAGIAANIWGGGMLSRAGEIVAGGALHSLIATETIRAAALQGSAAAGVAPGSQRGAYFLSGQGEQVGAFGAAPSYVYG